MKKLAFTIAIGSAVLLAACNNGNQDEVNNAELNQPASELNDLANEAVNTAAQANELNAAADNTTNPREADEQNVSGM
jgi:hypothetical protein